MCAEMLFVAMVERGLRPHESELSVNFFAGRDTEITGPFHSFKFFYRRYHFCNICPPGNLRANA